MTDWTIPELSKCHRKVWKENPNKTLKDFKVASAVARELMKRGFAWEELDAIFDKEY